MTLGDCDDVIAIVFDGYVMYVDISLWYISCSIDACGIETVLVVLGCIFF